MQFIAVLITVPNTEEGERISRALVGEKLAACVNVIDNVRSIYRWQGKVEDEREVLLIAKTRRELFGALRDRVLELHSYDVPEVVALPVVEGSRGYLGWLEEETER